jgi:hypothetical protein
MSLGGAFHPRVRYEVVGRSYEIGGLRNTGYAIRDAVPVAYPRDHPEDGIIDRPREKLVIPLGLAQK